VPLDTDHPYAVCGFVVLGAFVLWCDGSYFRARDPALAVFEWIGNAIVAAGLLYGYFRLVGYV
jgi:hypothetical protein